MNLLEIIRLFPTDDACRSHLEKIRWPHGVVCPRCDRTRTSPLKSRKQYTCLNKDCRYRFSVTVDTIFHRSHIPLTKWFLAIYLMSDAKKSVSSLQLHRELKISVECCWHMCHRIREAMREDHHAAIFKGIVQVDDYYVGGEPRPEDRRPLKRGRGTTKQPIVGAVEKQTGKVRTAVVPNLKGKTIVAVMANWMDLQNTELHSDEWKGYNKLGRMCEPHKVVNHSEWYVTKEGVHTNGIENAWSLFARGIMGAFHHISVKHLPRYLAEFDSRFNARDENGTYFDRILGNAEGRRLEMRTLVGPKAER